MAFFDNMGKRIGEAAQAAAKKSGELVEVTKLNVSINSEEDKIQKLYAQIGKKVYEKYAASGATDGDLTEECEAIKVHEQNIKNFKDKILEIKNLKLCTGCGVEMEKDQIFCSKCGARNEVAKAAEAPKEDAVPVCPQCGKQAQPGAIFCTFCGSKLG